MNGLYVLNERDYKGPKQTEKLYTLQHSIPLRTAGEDGNFLLLK